MKELKESTIKIIIGIIIAAIFLSAVVYFSANKKTSENPLQNKIEADSSSFEKNDETIDSPFKAIEGDPEKIFSGPSNKSVGAE